MIPATHDVDPVLVGADIDEAENMLVAAGAVAFEVVGTTIYGWSEPAVHRLARWSSRSAVMVAAGDLRLTMSELERVAFSAVCERVQGSRPCLA